MVLRAVSREAGVSHNAAYRHFSSHDALIAAVAERCMENLGTLMLSRLSAVDESRPVPRARARLDALGRAYVEFARAEPGWFTTAFTATHDAPVPTSELNDGGPHPFRLLTGCLDELAATGAIPPQRRPGAEYAAWSAVHGLSHLLIEGPLRTLPEEDVRLALNVTLDVVSRGL